MLHRVRFDSVDDENNARPVAIAVVTADCFGRV